MADEKNILNVPHLGVLLLDKDLCIRKFSPLASRVFNISQGDVGRGFRVPPIPSGVKLLGWIQDALEKKLHTDNVISSHGGETFAIKVVPYCALAPLSQVQGDASTSECGVVVSLVDISSIQALKETLRKSERRYKSVLNAISDGFFQWSHGQGLFVDENFKLALGYDRYEDISWSLILAPGSYEFKKIIEANEPLNRTFMLTVRLITSSRTDFWVIIKGEVKEGQMTGIFIDINHLKEKEHRLEVASTELIRSNRLLEDFAYIVSHDFKAPLRHIRNFIQFLGDAIEADDQEQVNNEMNNLVHSTKRLETLVDDMITLSRFTVAERQQKEVDLNQVFSSVFHLYSPEINEKKIEVECQNLPTVLGDRSLLEHLFQNLLGNACTYINEKDPKIKVWGRSVDSYYEINFEDNGIGFNSDQSEMIFKPFKRLVTQTEYAGSGIGLAICKTVVEQHQGQIHAHGIPGKGAKFTVLLRK